MDKSRPFFNPGLIESEPYLKRVEKPWGYELYFTNRDKPYIIKLIHVRAGKRTSVHLFDAKQETFVLLKGKAGILWETPDGDMQEVSLKLNHGYTTQVGQRHRICAKTDAQIMIGSTPEIGRSWRLDDDYGRPSEISLNEN